MDASGPFGRVTRVGGTTERPPAGGPSGARLLVAFENFDRDRHLLDYASRRASADGAALRVAHVIISGGPPDYWSLENEEDAESLVARAVALLRERGAQAAGCVKSSVRQCAGLAISEEAVCWGATTVVLGAPRTASPDGALNLADGVREQVLRCSWRPSILVAAPGLSPVPARPPTGRTDPVTMWP